MLLYGFGVILMMAACVCFFSISALSWFVATPRKFWSMKLTYEDDKFTQANVRFGWILAWIFSIAGAIMTGCSDPRIPSGFGWALGYIVSTVAFVWLLAKAILLLCIILQYAWSGLVRVWNWIFHDKALF